VSASRIVQAQVLVRRFAEGDFSARAQPSATGDEVDALLVGLNRLGEELSAAAEREDRLDLIQQFLLTMAEGRQPKPLPTSGRGDTFDAVRSGLNMLAEELEGAAERQLDLRSKALYDALTSLPNRVLLRDRLEMHLARAKRDDRQVAVLFIDLDGFKPINDRYGHDVGDAVLSEVAARLRGVVRTSDTIARYGGDEFVIAAVIRQLEDAEKIVDQAVRALEPQFACLEDEAQVSASIGVSVFPDHASELAELIQRADVAMYEQKRKRRSARLHQEGFA
jgi:diguanylate cyclase (GGDEF)-like protein